MICQAIPQPRRTSDSRRSTVAGFTPMLALIFMAELGTMILGRDGDVTSRSCPHGTSTRQVGRSGDTFWWLWWKSCAGCGTDGGTWSGSSSFRRQSCNNPVISPHPKQSVGRLRGFWTPERQGAMGCWWRRPLQKFVQYLTAAHREDSEEHMSKTYHNLVI